MARIQTPPRVRGTQDIVRDEERRFAHVLDTFDRVRKLYCFERVEVPVFEATEVFARSIGETTDVVSKEMYTFPDRGGDSLTLRPEFTAGIARAYITNGWQQYAPMKLAASGPVFRYERPQKGRYRQFHQIDAEVIGAPEPMADVELLTLADQLLHELGIADGVTLQLNTLGDAETRDAWRAALVAHFEGARDALSEDSVARLAKNPLRILDSKDPRDRPIADAAPGIDDYLTSGAGAFFERVTKGLDAAGVAWTRNARLVRGLDYYRHTAFEFVTDRLGAQGTVLAGGRYDGLIESLGGPATAGVGWAAGVERLAMLVGELKPDNSTVYQIAVVSSGDHTDELSRSIAHSIRLNARANFMWPVESVALFCGKSPKKNFEKANSKSACMILVHDPRGEEAALLRLYPGKFGLKQPDVNAMARALQAAGYSFCDVNERVLSADNLTTGPNEYVYLVANR